MMRLFTIVSLLGALLPVTSAQASRPARSSSPASTACPANPTTTVTVTEVDVSTATVTAGSGGAASTSYVFLPGSPPVTQRKKRSPCKPSSRSSTTEQNTTTASPTNVSITTAQSSPTESTATGLATSQISSSSTSGTISTITSTVCPSLTTISLLVTATAISSTTVTVSAPIAIQTVYPCANPQNFRGPTYADAQGTSNLGLSNSLFSLGTPQGASPQACCNTCNFETENCVQAYWYAYQGCVISQAQNAASSGTLLGISGSCPNGQLSGLTYTPDTSPAFRSTGNIAGPCGQSYSYNA